MGSIRLFAVIVVFGALVTVFSHAPVGASFGGLDDWSPSLRAQVDPRPSIPHDPPVVAPIVDPFRPPPQPWLPGNRGLEYGPTTGQTVRASADGVVTFAGPVAGNLFVTVRHDPALRTTVGFLANVLVASGEPVTRGQPIAVAGETLHFTARHNGTYIDPESLFVRYEVRIRLVE